VINANPHAHLEHLKPFPIVETEVDRCMECGFCEPHCPSRRLTLTPRQRIVLRREMEYLRETGSDPQALASIQADYPYYALDTCAADGLCARACPVDINTGDLVKHVRSEDNSAKGQNLASSLAARFGLLEGGMRLAVGLGHAAQSVTGAGFVTAVSRLPEKVTGKRNFKWNDAVPRPLPARLPDTDRETARAVYFPACISRVMGSSPDRSEPSLIDLLVKISDRAGAPVWVPPDSPGHCCGMPFSSKGYIRAFTLTIHATLQKFWEWSDHGRLPVVIDSSSCAYTLKTAQPNLSPEDQAIWSQLTLLDLIEFTHNELLPRLKVTRLAKSVVLHPNCSARKQELETQLLKIAQSCAESVKIPDNLDCCGFAGDRGLLYPELTLSATRLEAEEVLSRPYDGYYSTNLTCEIGMRMATRQPYRSFLYLVEEASR
jgi:D-lactate dehydrogenase